MLISAQRLLMPFTLAFVATICFGLAANFALAEDAPAMQNQTLARDMTLISGNGGNILVINGDRNLLVIDNGLAPQASALYEQIMKVGNKPIRFLVNTHWHYDHAGGNTLLGDRTNLVAHENVLARLSTDQDMKAFNRVVPAVPESGRPVITYTQSTTLHESGYRITLQHFPQSHTDGDSVVFVQPSNIVHMGDLYFAGTFPFVDMGSGGSVQGLADSIAAILERVNDETIIIPGHGPVSSKQDLKKYHAMIESSLSWMREKLAEGKTLEAINEEGLPESLETWGSGFIKAPSWIGLLYSSLQTSDMPQNGSP